MKFTPLPAVKEGVTGPAIEDVAQVGNLAAQADHHDVGEVRVFYVACQGPFEDFHTGQGSVETAPALVGQGDDPIDIGIIIQGAAKMVRYLPRCSG